MDVALLRSTFLKTTHIALLLALISLTQQISAQTILLPGDVVVVTVNGSSNSFSFIPLVDIESETSLFINDGEWNAEKQLLEGNEIQLQFDTSVVAGTNIYVNGEEDERYSFTGNVTFENETNHLFLYQKENQHIRFIYGVGWGEVPIWNSEDSEGSDLPEALAASPYSFVTLPNYGNFQYHLRNGASGTQQMLGKFVSEAANWRGSSNSFSAFGTSFNLLSPPVLLFESSVSTVVESDHSATLNVAIYEHDGSRLTVDVVYDSLRSITNTNDFTEIKNTTLNFTGLIGSGVYEVEIPLRDDNLYEGTETAIFSLKNLSKGNYGDFLSHSLMIKDDEQADIQIVDVSNLSDNQSYIDIRNSEDSNVSFAGWRFQHEMGSFSLGESDTLYAGDTLRFYHENNSDVDYSGKASYVDLELNEYGGVLELVNPMYEVISSIQYPAVKKEVRDENYTNEPQERSSLEYQLIEQQEIFNRQGGWITLPANTDLSYFSDEELFHWNSKKQRMENILNNESSEVQNDVIFGYVEREKVDAYNEWKAASRKKSQTQDLKFTLAAFDANENEIIDRLEGFNLIFNNTDSSISVQSLLSELSYSYSEVEVDETVYGVFYNSQGEIKFQPLTDNAYIQPKASFALFVKNPLEKLAVSIGTDKLFANASTQRKTDTNDEPAFILQLSNNTYKDSVEIKFGKEDIRDVKNLNSYPELFLPNQHFTQLFVNVGNEHFSKKSIKIGDESSYTIPLKVVTTEAGEFNLNIADWNNIPDTWEVILKDRKSNKEYNLGKDFQLNVENTNELNEENVEDGEELLNVLSDDRFVLTIKHSAVAQQEITEESGLPTKVELFQNYPNPFNPITTISFYLPVAEEVKLSVYNIVGQPVSVIANGSLPKGEHQFDWDATDRPSGMYIYQLEVGKKIVTRKMTLVK